MTLPVNLKADGYPNVLLAADLCRLFRIHMNTLYARIERGEVPAFERHGRRYEWQRHVVERWMASPPRQLRRAG